MVRHHADDNTQFQKSHRGDEYLNTRIGRLKQQGCTCRAHKEKGSITSYDAMAEITARTTNRSPRTCLRTLTIDPTRRRL